MTHIQTYTDQFAAVRPIIDFRADVMAASLRVRQALAAACASIGADPSRPRQFSRQTGWNNNLAWKVSRIVIGKDLLGSITLLPGRSGQRRILETFEQAGASSAEVKAVSEAMAQFEAIVERHAGRRDTFQKMLAEFVGDAQADQDEAFRKLAFEGNVAFWGVQARLRVSCNFIIPSAEGDRMDKVSISGMVDFQRLRINLPWTIASVGDVDDFGKPLTTEGLVPLDPTVGPGEPPLLRAFCSEGIPMVHVCPGENHLVHFRVRDGAIGAPGRFTCLLGWRRPALLTRWRSSRDRLSRYGILVNTPVEMLQYDLFVHRSLGFTVQSKVHVFSMLPGEPVLMSETDRTELRITEKVAPLPMSPLDVTTPEMPEYPRAVRWAFEQLGQSAGDFEGYRLRVPYPMLATKMAVVHERPVGPEA